MDESNFPQLEPSGADSGFTRAEKLGFAGLVILFVVIIYLGFSQLGNNIKSPFNSFIAKYSGGDEAASPPTDEAAIMEEAKNKDTDKDGLSDYDELYIFRTSPYLSDTDSDGIADKQEIEAGADPNCPQGKVCGGSNLTNPTAAVVATSTLVAPAGSVPSADQLLLQSILGSNPDAKTIREFLLKQGMDKKVLEKFSDAELVTVFKETMSNAAKPSAASQTFNQTLDIDKITPAQIRELLQQQGASTEQLKNISDEDLLKIFKEAAK